MIHVIVERQPANRQGPDISDSLITTEAVARERGRNEIDANSTNRYIVTGNGPLLSFIRPGSIVEVQQTSRPPYRAMVRKWALSITRDGDNFSATQSLELEREA